MDGLDMLADEITDRTESSMRRAIEKVPDGVYRAEGTVEQMEGREDLVIKAAVTIRGSDVEVDLAGSSPHVAWGGNVVYNFTYAYVFMALKSMFDPELPVNDGATRPISMLAPEGSVVHCSFPVAVAARMQIGHFLTEIVYRALAAALPQRVIAASGGTPATMNVFYGRRNDGRPFHSVIIRGGGMGAASAATAPTTTSFRPTEPTRRWGSWRATPRWWWSAANCSPIPAARGGPGAGWAAGWCSVCRTTTPRPPGRSTWGSSPAVSDWPPRVCLGAGPAPWRASR